MRDAAELPLERKVERIHWVTRAYESENFVRMPEGIRFRRMRGEKKPG